MKQQKNMEILSTRNLESLQSAGIRGEQSNIKSTLNFAKKMDVPRDDYFALRFLSHTILILWPFCIEVSEVDGFFFSITFFKTLRASFREASGGLHGVVH